MDAFLPFVKFISNKKKAKAEVKSVTLAWDKDRRAQGLKTAYTSSLRPYTLVS